MIKARAKEASHAGRDRFDFSKRFPLLSKIEKRINRAAAYAAIGALVAIGGANLGTYFDHVRNNYDYAKLGNRTSISLASAPREDELVKMALGTAKLAVVGHTAPAEASLGMELDMVKGTLSAHYQMVWNTNKGMDKRDVEDITVTWKLDDDNRFAPQKAVTRYHYKTVELDLPHDRTPVILIQNPAHTPGVPGTVPHYAGNDYGAVDAFTEFSATKWAGSCLSTGLPQKFGALAVDFKAEIEVK